MLGQVGLDGSAALLPLVVLWLIAATILSATIVFLTCATLIRQWNCRRDGDHAGRLSCHDMPNRSCTQANFRLKP